MKQLLLLSATTLVTVAVNAQIAKNDLKDNIRTLQQEQKITKEEIRNDKRETRKLADNEVRYQSQQAFYADFGNVVDPVWIKTAYYDQVTFTSKHGKRITAYYDYEAELVGTTTAANFSDLPANAQRYINNKYSGYSKEAAIFFRDNESNETDMVLYGGQFDDADNYFVELKRGDHKVVLRVDRAGAVTRFKDL